MVVKYWNGDIFVQNKPSIDFNKSIVGYKHSRTEEHKSCLYPDDFVVEITTLESLNELFRILKKTEYATNAKI